MRWLIGVGVLALVICGAASAEDAKPADAPKETPPARAEKKKRKKEKKERPFEPLRDDRLRLDFFPVGLVVPANKTRTATVIPMNPSGFRSNTYSNYGEVERGFKGGWEVAVGATGAERLHAGGEAVFYGIGVQKQIVQDRHGWPALSIGSYGLAGPHQQRSGMFYLAGTKRLLGGKKRGFGLFLHGGLRYERFGGDDYGEGDGLRPYGALSVAATPRLFFSAEVSPPQPWEIANVYSIRSTYLIYKDVGVTGGIHGDGYRTYPFIDVVF